MTACSIWSPAACSAAAAAAGVVDASTPTWLKKPAERLSNGTVPPKMIFPASPSWTERAKNEEPALVGVLQEVQVGREGRAVGLVGPVPWRSVDEEGRAVEVADASGRILAGLGELDVVGQRLGGGTITALRAFIRDTAISAATMATTDTTPPSAPSNFSVGD